MIDYSEFYRSIQATPLSPWRDSLPALINQRFDNQVHGHIDEWKKMLDQLPSIQTSVFDFNRGCLSIGHANECSAADRDKLERQLKTIMPWRKGPFDLFGIHIDTEWRSDLKWNRLINSIQSLKGKRVLDVGCGSGYHCLRMFGQQAEQVIGIEPLLRYIVQFYALIHFIPTIPVTLLPLTLQALPKYLPVFDTVFSMGVLYHRKSPFEHLHELKQCLKPGGELVLETLVVEGDEKAVLTPQDRYAKMRNVWLIPSCDLLTVWLARCGFKDIQLIDKSVTTTDEQRSTEWMTSESLAQFLNGSDSSLTIENHPAPCRAIFRAAK